MSIAIPYTVTNIENYAFRNCTGLDNVFMKPVTPPTASANLFSGCSKLKTIYVLKGLAAVYNIAPWNNYAIVEKEITTSLDGIYYSLNADDGSAEVISSPDHYAGSITIPASIPYEGQVYQVTSIASDAFALCTDLEKLTMESKTAPAADPDLFLDCLNLTEIYIPIGATSAYSHRPWTDFTLVDTITDIDEAEVQRKKDDRVFDLNGRCVGRADQLHLLNKGVYVVNGKKVLR